MALPVFTWIPNYTHTIVNRHKVLVSEMDNGTKKRYWKGRRPRRWSLSFTKRYQEIHEIYNFWDERKGPYENFNITLYNGVCMADETITVHFLEEEVEITAQGLYHGTITLTIEEVL